MFVGEAPGRLGADGTGIPFHGDQSGHNFEDFLNFAGLNRSDVFVTNAVLCNPKDDRGNNSTPDGHEVANCSSYLRQQVELINPPIVVTLGSTALVAASSIEHHNLSLRLHVRTRHPWFGRSLIPLYHPGQRAMIHRSLANQRSDYQFVAEELRRLGGKPRTVSGRTSEVVYQIVKQLLAARPEVSYFALHKLLYLTEYQAVRQLGARLTSAYFVRQKDGPYCTELHPAKLKRATPTLRFRNQNGKLFVGWAQGVFRRSGPTSTHSIVDDVLKRYGTASDADLKRIVYLTGPMRHVLRMERRQGINMYNAPIDFLV